MSSKEAQRTGALPLDLCKPLQIGPGDDAATKVSGVNLTAIQVGDATETLRKPSLDVTLMPQALHKPASDSGVETPFTHMMHTRWTRLKQKRIF
jgi:hypothetical protein